MSDTASSILVVRRSVHIHATPERVWLEFTSFERMNRWWGFHTGVPEAGKPTGQRLVIYEPRVGGRIEMEVMFNGAPMRYGGQITVFEAGRELTFECDWIPNQGWLRPTLLTIRLSAGLGGTLVELMHHGFEHTGPRGSDDHADYEGGWSMVQLNALRRVVAAG
jgi:uncharacterized protein YndB with AHSA1/START domain